MDQRNLRVLEFPKIREKMAAFAVSEMGRERALKVEPSGDAALVRRRQAETEEAGAVLAHNGSNPIVSFTDVREFLKMAQIGATLSAKALLQIADAIKASRLARNALNIEREDTPLLTALGSTLYTNRRLEEDIFDAILSEDEISDRASGELAAIRRHIRALNDRIRDKLNAIIRSASTQKYLMDAIITMRNGRYVVPVKAGMPLHACPVCVHDQSGSRRNAVHRAHGRRGERATSSKQLGSPKEQEEIQRILAAFCRRRSRPDAAADLRNASIRWRRLDVIFATRGSWDAKCVPCRRS